MIRLEVRALPITFATRCVDTSAASRRKSAQIALFKGIADGSIVSRDAKLAFFVVFGQSNGSDIGFAATARQASSKSAASVRRT